MKLTKSLIFCLAAMLLLALPAHRALGFDSSGFIALESLHRTEGIVDRFFIYPQVDTVGRKTTYQVEFVLTGDTLSPEAKIQLYFPVGFLLNAIDSVTYSDDDTSNAHYGIESFSDANDPLEIRMSSSGWAPASGSTITFRIYGLENATTVSSYQLILAIISSENELLVAPTWSSTFDLVPDRLAVFHLVPDGFQQLHAGTTLRFSVETYDQFSNPVMVQPIQWSVIGLPLQTGSIVGGDFQAKYTGASRIAATYQDFTDTSSTVYVLPGVFAYFNLSGGGDSATAGISWLDNDNDIVVTAYDLFNNVDYEFNGDIYFQSTDLLADLPFNAVSRYHFTPSDRGRHVFHGSSFRFFTAGRQQLSLVRDDVIQQTLQSIQVEPGALVSYGVSFPDVITAGHSFNAAVTNAIDSWGNYISGRVDCGLLSVTGASPSGALPSLPSFLVFNGSGLGSLVLVKAGSDAILTSLAGILIQHAIVVNADSLASFDFQLASPQVLGKPFVGTARLTALDKLANVVTSFSALSDPVTISASGSGQVLNSTISQATAFMLGICDLKTVGTGYSGSDPFASFTATSISGKRGVSPVVGFSVVKITGGSLVTATRYAGEQFIFNLTISNFGSQSAKVDSIRIYVGTDRITASTVDRPLPDVIVPLSSRVYSITGVTPSHPGQMLDLAARFFGSVGSISLSDSASNLATLTILPADAVGDFGLSGGAEISTAGVSWNDGVNDVVVTAYDRFGNIDNEFNGEVYFQSTDPLAELPYKATSRYRFVAADHGQRLFHGSGFRFFTAGRQQLSLVKDGVVQKTLRSIQVEASALLSYAVVLPDTVTAGHVFDAGVTNAADSWGNPVSGQVDYSLSSGLGASPSGALPSLPSFLVTNGSGSESLMLVRAGGDTIQTAINDKIVRHAITVIADSLSAFDFRLNSPQVIGMAFWGMAQLTAMDKLGNIVTDFYAPADPITISSSGGGKVLNGLINLASAFVNGTCDLKTIGTGYSGNDFYTSFTASSQSGKKGVSPVVGFSTAKIKGGSFVSPTRYIGQQFVFDLKIASLGSQPAVIDSIRIYGGNSRFMPITLGRSLPDTLEPPAEFPYSIIGITPNLPNQTLDFAGQFFGHIGSSAVTDSVAGLATLTILPLEGISLVAQSLSPQQVTVGREYAFSIRLRNDSEDDLRLTTETQLLTGHPQTTLALIAPAVVPPKTSDALLQFMTGVVPAVTGDSIKDISIRLVGALGSAAYDHTLSTATTVIAQTPPAFSYQTTSLSPSTIFRGRDVALTLDIMNSGAATLSVNSASTELSIYAVNRHLTARLDAPQMDVGHGVTKLVFESLSIPDSFPTTVDSVIVNITGTANSHTEIFRLHLAGSIIFIPAGAAVQIVSTNCNAPNAPYVNLGQLFAIDVSVRNRGAEPLRDIDVKLTSNGGSSFTDNLRVSSLALAADTTLRFNIQASLTARASELFTASIAQAYGASSEMQAQILPPLSGTQIIVIQTPANLFLTSAIASPPDAQDGVVTLSSSFTLSADVDVDNHAQSSVGEGELTLKMIAGSFTTGDPLTHSFHVGDKINWTIKAPATNDTGKFEISISSIPPDNNTGMAARIVNRTDTITVIASETQVSINVDFTANSSPLLSAGGNYEILTLDFAVVGESEAPYLKFIDFALRDRLNRELDPSAILTAATLRYNDQSSIIGVTADNHYRFNLGANYGSPRKGVIAVTLRPDPQVSDFTIYLDSTSFAAEYQIQGGVRSVPVSARFASRLLISKDFTLVSTALDKSFFSYPNPFSPPTDSATLVYHLAAAKPATLNIYTLSGDKVISRTIASPISLNEPVTVIWDGRNGDGQIVLNGVYIAVLTVDGMPEVRTKIAVVK